MILKFLISAIYIYSQYIQNVVFEDVPYVLLFLGIVLWFILLITMYKKSIIISKILTTEYKYALTFIITSFVFGIFTAPSLNLLLDAIILVIQGTALSIAITYEIKMKNSLNWIINVIILTSMIQGLSLIFNPVEYTASVGRYSIADNVNPNGLAISLLYGIFFILYKLKYMRGLKRYAFILSISILVYGIIQTGSRKGFIGFIIMIILWILFCYNNSRLNMSLYSKIFDVIVVSTAFIVGFNFLQDQLQDSVLLLRIQSLVMEGSESRGDLYIYAWEIFKQHPIFGIGLGNYSYYFKYYSHSTYAEIISSVGIIGTLIYIGIWVPIGTSISRNLLKKWNRKLDIGKVYDVDMMFVLFSLIVYFGVSIIHFYQIDSYFILGIVVGWKGLIDNPNLNTKINHI